MKIEYLDWDSTFFQKKTYRITVNEPLNDLLINKTIADNKAELVYIFSDSHQPFFEKYGMQLVDVKITYEKNVQETFNCIDSGPVVYKGKCSESLYKLAFQSGRFSRFLTDTLLAPKFNQLYSLWLEKSIDRTIADEVFVHYNSKNIIGFVTVKKKMSNAVIGLIAVDENYQGKGVGKKLLSVVENWCLQNKLQKIQVTTQKQNINACNFYQHNGYVVKSVEYIYHFHTY